MLRYHETKELALDFHGSTNTACDYIGARFGREALDGIFRTVGKKVYKSIHDKLAKGDPSELIEHLQYFYTREHADFELKTSPGEIVLEVRRCPAVAYLQRMGFKQSPWFCDQTSQVNAGMCEDTPWETETTVSAPGVCRQVFRRRKEDAQ